MENKLTEVFCEYDKPAAIVYFKKVLTELCQFHPNNSQETRAKRGQDRLIEWEVKHRFVMSTLALTMP